MLSFPTEPDLPCERLARGSVPLRYQDISQDGRLVLRAIPASVGAIVWRNLLADHPVHTQAREAGILAILSRIVLEGGDGPLSVRGPLRGEGGFELAHSSGAGDPEPRIHLNVWVRLYAPLARTHGPPPEHAGEERLVGRIFAEHVFSRPFASPAQRRVTHLEGFPGLEAVPATRHDFAPPERLLEMPLHARALEGGLIPDPTPVVMGLGHTDSNQHVNSLVYPRFFEDAALRRLDALGHDAALLPIHLDIAYRKPCFAGDRMRIDLTAFELDGRLGAVGAFVRHDAPPAGSSGAPRPHCTVRVLFDRMRG